LYNEAGVAKMKGVLKEKNTTTEFLKIGPGNFSAGARQLEAAFSWAIVLQQKKMVNRY